MNKNAEMLPFEQSYVSPEAISALQELGIDVREDNGFKFEVPRSECSWNSDDNGGSYDIVIRERLFWLNCNDDIGGLPGLQFVK